MAPVGLAEDLAFMESSPGAAVQDSPNPLAARVTTRFPTGKARETGPRGFFGGWSCGFSICHEPKSQTPRRNQVSA